jgi:hypothetical protein
VDAGAAADTECAALVILRTAELVWRSSSQRVSLTIARLVADGMVRVEHVLKWAFSAADVVPEGAAAGGGAAPVPRIVAADEMTATAALETVMVLFVTMLDQGEVRAMSLQLPLRPCLLRVARGANTGVATGAPGEGSGPPGRAAGARGGSCETGGRHGCRAGAEPGRGHHRRGPPSSRRPRRCVPCRASRRAHAMDACTTARAARPSASFVLAACCTCVPRSRHMTTLHPTCNTDA